jgi:CBS domain-containing protein
MKKTTSKTASKSKTKSKLAAKSAASNTQAQQRLKEIMTPNVEVVNPEDSLQVAARKMQERDIGFLPVCDENRLIGTLSDRDITIRAVSAGRDPKSTTVREFATPHTVWAYDDEAVKQAVQKMQDARVRRLMVLRREDRKLVGVVSLGDLAANGTKKLSSEVLESTSPAVD